MILELFIPKENQNLSFLKSISGKNKLLFRMGLLHWGNQGQQKQSPKLGILRAKKICMHTLKRLINLEPFILNNV